MPMCHALVDAMLLLESAAPDEIDPDIAVRGMENISSSLLMLDSDDQRLLRQNFLDIAERSDDDVYAKFVRSLPEMIGLAD